MADAKPNHAAMFRRSAIQRYEEAQVLRLAARTTGAIYLAGYGVECILKALILSTLPASRVATEAASFRGRRAHDYDWLRARYRELGGAALPRVISRHFLRVSGWSTDVRYMTQTYDAAEADRFLAATLAIINWSQGRL